MTHVAPHNPDRGLLEVFLMYRDFTTLRGQRAEASRAGIVGHVHGPLPLLLVASLAGCSGSIGAARSPQPGAPGAPSPGSPPSSPGVPGVPNPGQPPVNVPPRAPTVCKADQVGLSPMRRLTRIEYDNSIKDLLGVD